MHMNSYQNRMSKSSSEKQRMHPQHNDKTLENKKPKCCHFAENVKTRAKEHVSRGNKIV